MARLLLLLAFHCTSPGDAHAGDTMAKDLQRARTKMPGKDYRGDNHVHAEVVLNRHLMRAEKERTRACHEWTLDELHDTIELFRNRRHETLQNTYLPKNDSRSLWMSGDAWRSLIASTKGKPHRFRHLQHAMCRESVMIWTHHLTEPVREALRAEQFIVPMLAGQSTPDGTPCEQETGNEHAQHFCKTLEKKKQEMNCHADRPCLTKSCGSGPFPVSWPKNNEFMAEYYSPSKQTNGTFAIGKDRDGIRAGIITFQDGTWDHLSSFYHNHTMYTMYMTKNWRWLAWPKLKECCKCCDFQLGCGPLDGTWLENATGRMTYLGTDELPYGDATETCKKWDYEGWGGYNYYFEHIAPNGERPLPCAIRGINYMTVEAQNSDDYYVFNKSTYSTNVPADLFDLPDYCKVENPICNGPTGRNVCGNKGNSDEKDYDEKDFLVLYL